MGALKQQEESLLTARMRCRAPPLFVPSSMLSIRVTESDPKSAKKAQGGVEADADSDPEPYSMKSAGCILRTVTSSALGNRDKADSLSPSHSAVDSTLNRVKTISSALSIAGSANALVLSQAILNALVRTIILTTIMHYFKEEK